MSAHVYYQEWRTANSQRRFPFADDCSMTASSGYRLPDNVFVDAMFFPIGLKGQLCLTSINFSDGLATISDQAGVMAEAELTLAFSGGLDFHDQYGRCLGVLVPGPGFDGLSVECVFPYGAAPLCAACCAPQNYDAVTAILLDDGTLVCGDVYWEGENGIVAYTTTTPAGEPAVRFDAVGVPEGEELPCGLGDPVKCLRVKQTGTGKRALSIGKTGNIITLSASYDLQELCATRKNLPDADGNLPSDRDACESELGCCTLPDESQEMMTESDCRTAGGAWAGPGKPCCPSPAEGEEPCSPTHYTEYFIWPANDSVELAVEDWPTTSAEELARAEPSTNPESLPARPVGAIRISMKGVQT